MQKKKIYKVDDDLNFLNLKPYLNFEVKPSNISNKRNFIKGIYISGKPGVGKTTFLKHVIKHFALKLKVENGGEKVSTVGKSTYVFNVNNWIRDIQKSWNRERNSYEGDIKIPSKVEILLIDDIGAEFFAPSTYPYLLNVFEERFEYINKLNLEIPILTIITSNYSLKELIDKYKNLMQDKISIDRLESRILGIIDCQIEFEGVDKRIQ